MLRYLITLIGSFLLMASSALVLAAPDSTNTAQPTSSSAVVTTNSSDASSGATVNNTNVTPASTSALTAGQSYSLLQLLKLGYAVEAKNFASGESAADGVAKSAVWKTNEGTQEFWQGYINTNGQIVITQKLSSTPPARVLNSNWNSGASNNTNNVDSSATSATVSSDSDATNLPDNSTTVPGSTQGD